MKLSAFPHESNERKHMFGTEENEVMKNHVWQGCIKAIKLMFWKRIVWRQKTPKNKTPKNSSNMLFSRRPKKGEKGGDYVDKTVFIALFNMLC